MHFSCTRNLVDAHAEGESGKVVIGGLGPVPGETMFDKRVHLEAHIDQLRAGVDQYEVFDPENADVPGATQTLFAGPLEREDGIIRSLNSVVVSPGRLDRSPCGTGTSVRLAVLHAHGQIEQGELLFQHGSVIGTQFDSRVEATPTVGPYDAVVPSIAGRAWITSFNEFVLDPTDPFQVGFVVGRPWQQER